MKKNFLKIIIGAALAMLIFTGCTDIEDTEMSDAEISDGLVDETEDNETNENESEGKKIKDKALKDADDEEEEELEEEAGSEEETEDEDDMDSPRFTFSTTDIEGNSVSLDDFSDAKLIMVNFWEPWCGPCVGEMPDLEELYEEYSSEGLVILGVFSSADMTDEAMDVMDQCGTTYPILNFTESMSPYTSEYVPTTIFIDKNGKVLSDEPIIGANSYDDWEQIIEDYLN